MATPSPVVPNASAVALADIKREPRESEPLLPPLRKTMPPAELLVASEHSQQREQQKRDELLPQFLKSIDELGSISYAIVTFKSRFGELRQHLDSIRDSIDSKFKDYGDLLQDEEVDAQLPGTPPRGSPEKDRTEQPKKTDLAPAAMGQSKETDSVPAATVEPSRSEIQRLCESMSSRGVRRFITGQLPDVSKLRKEVPEALKLAPNPKKLVFECFGRFYLQGSRAYTKDSGSIASRRASILTLECFLLMLGDRETGDIEIDSKLKSEMQEGAITWRKRLVGEGGLGSAAEIDARGLLLFIACFGIPDVFTAEDIGNLLRLCNLREISDALRNSSVLLGKIPEIIESMVKNGKHVEAIDLARTLSMGEEFSPQKILMMVLRESKEVHKKALNDAKSSPVALKQANEKQLAALKSVLKCIRDHGLDPAKHFGGWQIKEMMTKLEKAMSDLDKQIRDRAAPKRRIDETTNHQEKKRPRFPAKEPLQPLLAPSPRPNGFYNPRAGYGGGAAAPSPLGVGPVPVSDSSLVAKSYPSGGGGGLLPLTGLGAPAHGPVRSGSLYGQDMGILDRPTGPSFGENHGSVYGPTPGFLDRPVGPSFGGSRAGVGSSYGPMPGFAGLSDYPPSSGGSDLYGFADIVEREAHGGGFLRSGGLTVPSYRPSYM